MKLNPLTDVPLKASTQWAGISNKPENIESNWQTWSTVIVHQREALSPDLATVWLRPVSYSVIVIKVSHSLVI